MATNGEITPEDLAALMTLADDVRCEIIEAQKAIAAALQGPIHAELQTRLDALWTVVTQPPENPAVPLLEEVIACLTPKPVSHAWWYPWRWPAEHPRRVSRDGGGLVAVGRLVTPADVGDRGKSPRYGAGRAVPGAVAGGTTGD